MKELSIHTTTTYRKMIDDFIKSDKLCHFDDEYRYKDALSTYPYSVRLNFFYTIIKNDISKTDLAKIKMLSEKGNIMCAIKYSSIPLIKDISKIDEIVECNFVYIIDTEENIETLKDEEWSKENLLDNDFLY